MLRWICKNQLLLVFMIFDKWESSNRLISPFVKVKTKLKITHYILTTPHRVLFIVLKNKSHDK